MYNNKKTFVRSRLSHYIRVASGVSLMALGSVAWAQEEAKDESNETESMEEVTVTGQRASILSAQDIKRDASQIVDSIVASDIGKLPDRSITEALQRVPGVTVTRYDNMGDPEHFAGEGAGVAVRGLSQVRSELNGRDVFAANGGRSLSFDDVPAELMAGVDTYKSPTADMIEGGLGGVVNLRTRMPFDSDGQLFSATVKGNYGDQIKETNGEYSALFSDRWDTGIGEFGVLVNLSTSDLSSRADNIYTRAFFPRDDVQEDSTVWVPRGVDWRRNDYQRERDGQYLALQWAPNDAMEVYATAFRSKHEQRWDEAAFFNDALDVYSIASPNNDWVFDDNGALVSGTLTGKINESWVDLDGDGVNETKTGEWWGMPFGTSTRYSQNVSETTDFSLGMNWQATERLSIKADLQRVESESATEDYTLGLVALPSSVSVGNLNGKPSLGISSAQVSDEVIGVFDQHETDLANPAAYSYGQMMSMPSDNKGDSTSARLDLEYEFENSLIRSVQAGARYSEKSATNRSANHWSARYQPWTNWLYPFPGAAESDLVEFSFNDFQRGNTDVPLTAYLLDPALLRDFRGTTDRIVANSAGCCGPDWNALDLSNPANLNSQEETTQAVYAKVNFAFDDLAMPVDGNLGLRYIHTENTAQGRFNMQQSTITVGSEEEGNSRTIVVLPAQTYDFPAKNDYDHLLPSLNLRMAASEDVVVRFAASKAIWRPEFWRMKAYLNLSAGLKDGVTLDGNPDDITLESLQDKLQFNLSSNDTNPFLEPMLANQYDLSTEWYFDENGGMAHLSIFRKDISDYFTTVVENAEVEGFDTVSTWVGNDGEARIQGAEIGVTKFFDFLPEPWNGFGVQANYTYIDSSLEGPQGTNTDGSGYGDLPAEGISQNAYNLVGMYEKHGFYTRLAWNWRSEYLVAVGANGWNGSNNNVNWRLPVYNDDYGQLDLSMGYNITDNISVNFEAANLTREETVGLMDQGEIGKRHAYTYSQDVRYAASVRITF
ncbi:TonB-dependent receptor [Microbulbifer bruguierae]|uniref:TonB-dependent receptor n=1 Tax=Microbulbifer bruguierae TaxID=3029061 RepID=A0ABY8NHG5_9GAMM|nr:TonB-dependent receptor [Microbulbifer bruguierae]WGL18374.1 TonB-dependent receptor [Microbulbifer bruguierae]